jgi:hypothetical protein
MVSDRKEEPVDGQMPIFDYLPAVRAKMERARSIQTDLQQQIHEFLSSGKFDVDYQRESGETWVLALRMEEAPPISWSTLVGDVIHNLRSSLDLALFSYLELVCPTEFAQLKGNVQRKIQFPIFDEESCFDSRDWLAGIPANQLRMDLKEMQPFHLAQFIESDEDKVLVVRNSPLGHLRDMSNRDKHRGLHLVVAGLDSLALGLESGQVSDWELIAQPPWQNGDHIFRVTVTEATHLEKLNLTHSFEISLESDSRPLQVYSILSKLDSIRSSVEWCHCLLWRWQNHIGSTGI